MTKQKLTFWRVERHAVLFHQVLEELEVPKLHDEMHWRLARLPVALPEDHIAVLVNHAPLAHRVHVLAVR